MSTQTELKALSSRLEQKEAEIADRIEALQGEIEQTGDQIKGIVKNNPWVTVGGSLLAGLAVGLLLGKGGGSRAESKGEDFAVRLAEIAMRAGLSDREISGLLRDAKRETGPSMLFSAPQAKKKGIVGKLFGIAADVGLNVAKKQFMTYLDSVVAGLEQQGGEADQDGGKAGQSVQ